MKTIPIPKGRLFLPKSKMTILSKKGGKTIKGGRRTGRNDDDDSSDDNDW